MKGCCKPGLAYKRTNNYYCTETPGTCPFQNYEGQEPKDQLYLLQPRSGETTKAAKCKLMEIIQKELGEDTEEFT